jgi:hypothetical protein
MWITYLKIQGLAVTLHTTRFNIQKFKLRLYVVYGFQNKQRLLPYTTLAD